MFLALYGPYLLYPPNNKKSSIGKKLLVDTVEITANFDKIFL